MVNLGADLGLIGFAAFLRRAAAPWPAVAALESREYVSPAADRQMTSDFQTLRFDSHFRLNYAHFSQTRQNTKIDKICK